MARQARLLPSSSSQKSSPTLLKALQALATLQTQVQSCQAEVERRQKQMDELGETIGGLKNRLDTLTRYCPLIVRIN